MTQPSGPQYPHNPQQAYGQPGQYAPQPPGYPPPKKKSPLPWILGIVLVLVLAGGGVAAWLLLGDDSDANTAEAAADRTVQAINDRDDEAFLASACDPDSAKNAFGSGGLASIDDTFTASLQRNVPPEAQDKVQGITVAFERGAVNETGDTATAQLQMTFENVPPELQQAIEQNTDDPRLQATLNLKNEADGWCAAGLSR